MERKFSRLKSIVLHLLHKSQLLKAALKRKILLCRSMNRSFWHLLTVKIFRKRKRIRLILQRSNNQTNKDYTLGFLNKHSKLRTSFCFCIRRSSILWSISPRQSKTKVRGLPWSNASLKSSIVNTKTRKCAFLAHVLRGSTCPSPISIYCVTTPMLESKPYCKNWRLNC